MQVKTPGCNRGLNPARARNTCEYFSIEFMNALPVEEDCVQEHYCIAAGINDRAGRLEGFDLPVYKEAKPLLPSKGLPNAD